MRIFFYKKQLKNDVFWRFLSKKCYKTQILVGIEKKVRSILYVILIFWTKNPHFRVFVCDFKHFIKILWWSSGISTFFNENSQNSIENAKKFIKNIPSCGKMTPFLIKNINSSSSAWNVGFFKKWFHEAVGFRHACKKKFKKKSYRIYTWTLQKTAC